MEKSHKKHYKPKHEPEAKTEQEQELVTLTDAQRSELKDNKKKHKEEQEQQTQLQDYEKEIPESEIKPRPYPGFSKSAKKCQRYGQGKAVQKEQFDKQEPTVELSEDEESSEDRGGRWRRGGRRRARRVRGCKHSRSRSRSNSSSSESSSSQKEEEQSSRISRVKGKKKEIMNRISTNPDMRNFFVTRKINPEQQEKITSLLASRLNEPLEYNINILMYGIEQLQGQGKTQHLPYHKVIKVLVRFQLNVEAAWHKVAQIQQKRIKRIEADRQYKEKYGEEAVPLRKKDLVQLDLNKWIFLIDGNNLLPTQKHLRKFFKGNDKNKAEAQVRLRWYLSNCLPHYCVRLFYDQQYPVNDYLFHMANLIPQNHQGPFTNLPVVYGEGKKADDRIVETVFNIQKAMPEKKILLVSADRQLHQRCQQNGPINHTSGKFLFKYLRFCIFRRFDGIKDKQAKEDRKIIRRILKYQ